MASSDSDNRESIYQNKCINILQAATEDDETLKNFLSELDPVSRFRMLKDSRDERGKTIVRRVTERNEFWKIRRLLDPLRSSQRVILLTEEWHDGTIPLANMIAKASAEDINLITDSLDVRDRFNLWSRQDRHGNTGLYMAVVQKRADIIKHVFNSVKTSPLSIVTHLGDLLLAWAVKMKNSDSLKPALRDVPQESMLNFLGAWNTSISVYQQHLLSLSYTEENNTTLINLAVQMGRLDVVRCILKGLEPQHRLFALCSFDEEGKTPLHTAITLHSLEIVKALVEPLSVEKRIVVAILKNSKGHTPLHAAILLQSTSIVQYLLDCIPAQQIAVVAQCSVSPVHRISLLHDAATLEDAKLIAMILQTVGPRDNVELLKRKNDQGDTPLHCVVKAKCLEAVVSIVKHVTLDDYLTLLIQLDSQCNIPSHFALHHQSEHITETIIKSLDLDSQLLMLNKIGISGRLQTPLCCNRCTEFLISKIPEAARLVFFLTNDCDEKKCINLYVIASFKGPENYALRSSMYAYQDDGNLIHLGLVFDVLADTMGKYNFCVLRECETSEQFWKNDAKTFCFELQSRA